jgi:hypothetical protein
LVLQRQRFDDNLRDLRHRQVPRPGARLIEQTIHCNESFPTLDFAGGKKSGPWKASYQSKRDEYGIADNVTVGETSF